MPPEVTPPDVRPVIPLDWADIGIIALASIATIFVHPVSKILGHPYWLDESWVAVLTRAPLSELPRLSSSAPVGFVALLRLAPGHGLQSGRLVVLGFSVLTVVVTYVMVHALGWRTGQIARFAAIMASVVVMLAPVSLIRNDLKQYTCDAFCAILLFAVGAAAERASTVGSLVWLGIAAVVTMPFSSTVLFVTVAVFAGLLVSALIDGAHRRAVEVLVVGAVTGAVLAAYFLSVVAPNLNDKLRAYWTSQYLTGSPFHVLLDVWNRLERLGTYVGMPSVLFALLFASGIVVFVRLGARSLAVAFPFLWVEMIFIGRFHRYPFLDLRTSHFLLVSSLVVVAIGIVGVLGALYRLVMVEGTVLRSNWAVVAVGLGIVALVYFVNTSQYVHDLHLPNEDVRAQTLAVAERHHRGDVIVVNSSGNFGFSYYWPDSTFKFVRDDSGQGFRTRLGGVLYAPSARYNDVLKTLRAARLLLRQGGPTARIFIVRTHINHVEAARWKQALIALELHPRLVPVGPEPLMIVDSAARNRA